MSTFSMPESFMRFNTRRKRPALKVRRALLKGHRSLRISLWWTETRSCFFQTARWTPSSSKTVPPYIREWITREWGDSAEMRPAKSKKARGGRRKYRNCDFVDLCMSIATRWAE